MKTQKGIKKTPKHGFINELLRLCGYNRNTVRTALYDHATDKKADFVRKMYHINKLGTIDYERNLLYPK